jgi:hypothetical protein
MQSGMELSAESFENLSQRHKSSIKAWVKSEQYAQLNRHKDICLMDIYDTTTTKGMHSAHMR